MNIIGVLKNEKGRGWFVEHASRTDKDMKNKETKLLQKQLKSLEKEIEKIKKLLKIIEKERRTEDCVTNNLKVPNNKYNYKLADDRLLHHILTITEYINDNIVTFKAKILSSTDIQLEDKKKSININDFISKLENRDIKFSIKMGFFRFEDVYTEEKR